MSVHFVDTALGDEKEDDVELKYESLEHVTEKAALFVIGGEKHWIPKSQISNATATHISISLWFADKENLPY
jgi:hypothetical protein